MSTNVSKVHLSSDRDGISLVKFYQFSHRPTHVSEVNNKQYQQGRRRVNKLKYLLMRETLF